MSMVGGELRLLLCHHLEPKPWAVFSEWLVEREGEDSGKIHSQSNLCRLVAKSCPTLVTPWTVAGQVHLSMGFSRQEYWRGLPFPSPGDLPDLGIKHRSPALQAESCLIDGFFTDRGSQEACYNKIIIILILWMKKLKLKLSNFPKAQS